MTKTTTRTETTTKTKTETMMTRMIDASLPHSGHPVQAGHPDYPVPAIQTVLQGQVYHSFGII